MEATPILSAAPAQAPTFSFAPSPHLDEPVRVALDPPGHPRRRIVELVCSRPGASITDLADATGLGHTTVCHHLAVLQRRELVVRERWGGAVRIFPTNLSPTHRALLALVRSGKTGAVLRALAEQPRATPATLARSLGLHRQAVQWHLARLEKAGMVRVDREHRPYRISLTVRPDALLRMLPPEGPAEPLPAEDAAAPARAPPVAGLLA